MLTGKQFYDTYQTTWHHIKQDLKSCLQQCKCGFNSHPEYKAVLLNGFVVWYNINTTFWVFP